MSVTHADCTAAIEAADARTRRYHDEQEYRARLAAEHRCFLVTLGSARTRLQLALSTEDAHERAHHVRSALAEIEAAVS